MNRPTIKRILPILIVLFLGLNSFAQNYEPFKPRFNKDLKGDIVLIGNNILGPYKEASYNGNKTNDAVDMKYIDIDGDPATFSSSSADLDIPNPNCYEIEYAGIYWSAVSPDKKKPINKVKFKGPIGGYNDITGEVIFDAGNSSVDGGNSYPYVCYADVTAIVKGLGNNLGTYTLANVSSREGKTEDDGNLTGNSAGWSLVVVYNDPSLPGKSITSFDGFSQLKATTNPNVDILLDGFRTVPAPSPVRANFSFAALEGDKTIKGDVLKLNGRALGATDRPTNNFFNSSVTQLDATPVTNRNPNSTNTLGFDTGILDVPNPDKKVIANNATSATVRLETSQDTYFPYYFSFAVEIIEPDIVLTKVVEDELGNNISNQTVNLGQELNYRIGFQNTGNDDAKNFTIRDILPINIIFDDATGLTLPPGVTVDSYDPETREIVFSIPDKLVKENAPAYEILIEVQVVVNCQQLVSACSNLINNQAFATYEGTLNPNFTISDDPSYSTNTGCLITPQSTNFLADIDDCVFSQNEILCGSSLQLTAGDGYSSYAWSTSSTGTPEIGTGQTITVTEAGTYYSINTADAPCRSIVQEYVVTRYGGNITNPIIPFADEVVICPNNNKKLPNIFLCGKNDVRKLSADIDGASSIIWEKLDESSLDPDVTNDDCANEDKDLTWNQVASGPKYNANTSGQFRLTVNYEGGCFNQFYFNVYQNLLEPTVSEKDIICTTPGSITVNNVPSGYEYSLDGSTYQASNIFPITTADTYTVSVRQTEAPAGACVFTVPYVHVRERDFTVSVGIDQPLCNGDKGTIRLAANGVEPQYIFSLSLGGTEVNSVGPIDENNYEFKNLNPGIYTATVSTADGCTDTQDIEIIEPDKLTVSAAITAPLTCTDGEITVTPQGGTAPYYYFINGSEDFEIAPKKIIVTIPGTYNIRVVDKNNCEAFTQVIIEAIPAPVFTIDKTDIICAGDGDAGTITIDVTNANGNTLAYSIDGGSNYSPSNVFTGLATGSYDVIVKYTYGTPPTDPPADPPVEPSVCTTVIQTVKINANTAISGIAELTTPYTCTSTGEIIVKNVEGGTTPYMYSIDGVNFVSSSTFSNLTQGTYSFVIRDANKCIFETNEIIIAPLNPPTDLMFSNTALTCPSNTSDITITGTTGGTPNLEYQIIAPTAAATSYSSSNVFAGLAPGTYTFQVKDANNCTYSEDYTIKALPALTVTGQNLSDISCFGESDGSIQFTVSGSTGFEYTLNGGTSNAGTSPLVLTELGAGDYTIIVTDDATNCTATATATVNAPTAALAITTEVSPITCLVDGRVVIKATGGWGSNMYSLTLPDNTKLGAQNSGTFNNLTQAGTYTATVVDANGCTKTKTFDLTKPTGPVASISTDSNLCYDATNGATLEVTASGGVIPYEYNINGGTFQSSNIFTNLVPETYIIIVRDAYGCPVTLATQIIQPQLSVSTKLTKDLDCTTSPDAVITGTITGGYAPYTYEASIDGAAYTSLGATTTPFTYTTSVAGTYKFRVTDTEGCVTESGVSTIAAITTPTATAIPTDPTCFNETNGEIQLLASGGAGGYTFSFNGGAFSTTSLYSALDAKTTTATTTFYTYQVKDSNECLSPIYNITLNNPTEVEAAASIPANTTCNATTVITITATGGTGSYKYRFKGGAYLNANTYTVTNTTTTQTITYSVRDANGCIDTETIEIPPFDPLTGMTFGDNTITCNNTTTDVTVTPTNGVAPFTFEITAPGSATGNTTGATTGVFTGVTPGNYTFKITDANGCSVSNSHTIAPAVNIAVSATGSDEVCFGDNNGKAIFTITDVSSSGNYTYTITPSSSTATKAGNVVTVTGLSAGTYTINVIDSATGCIDSASVTIEAATQIIFSASATNVNCNNSISTISFSTLSGGTPGYSYTYVKTGAPTPAAGDYSKSTTVDTGMLGLDIDVYVMDSNNCVVMNSIIITSDPLPTISAAVDNQCTASGNNFTITATASSGVAPYRYSIDGINFQNSATFTVAAGTYTVTVKDDNGCTADTNPVTVYKQLTLSAVLDKDITCSVPAEGQVTLTATGGNIPAYTYESSTNGGTTYSPMATNVLNTTTPGSYTFRVTDANGCVSVTPTAIDLTTPVNPDITVAQTAFINCNGEETAAISITPNTTLGEAPYVYEVINTTTPFNYGTQTSGLAAGIYTVTVTDAKGCTEVENIIIGEPDPIVVNHSSVPITCGLGGTGISKGSVIVDDVTGGTPPYNYYVTGTNGYAEEEIGNPGTTSVTFNVVDFGLYQINVVDANGCSVLIQDVLVASPPDDLDIIIDTTANCASGGEATVSIGTTLAGTGPYYFAIYNGTIPTTPPTLPAGGWQTETTPGSESTVFTGLTPGVLYTFIVYDTVTGCYYFESAANPIPTNATITATAVTSNNITCKGSADGNVSFTLNNPETIPIDVKYEIFNSLSLATTAILGTNTVPAGSTVTVNDLGPLPFGNYYVLIKEESGLNIGCSIVTLPFNITESAIDLSLTASVTKNENCNDLGVISATASFGTAPYKYQILLDTDTAPIATSTEWATANTFNVAANGYTVYTIDAYGCIKDFDINLTKDAEPIIDTQTAPCYVGTPINVTITGTVAIGTPLYSINGTAYSSNPNFTIAAPETYTLYIKDGNGCVATTPYVVNDQLTLSAELTKELDCKASPDAEITLTAAGGDTTYTYEFSTNGGTTYNPMATNVYTATTSGTYTFRVTDAAGCQATIEHTLDPIPAIVFSTVETNVSCNGGSDGTITVNVTAGVGDFKFQLNGGGTPQDSNVFTDLSQGTTYVVTVIDAKSCTMDSASITINEPTAVTESSTLSGNSTCDVETVITVSGNGGTPTGSGTGYYYNFGNGFTTNNTYTVNNNGTTQTINYTVRDANGCDVSGSIDVHPLDPPTDLDFSATAITCLVSTGNVTLTETNGVGTSSYKITSPASATTNTTGASTGDFTGLTPDDYIFQVTDANGCSYQELYTLKDVENITVTGQLISDVTCNPGTNGEVLFNISNFSGNYSYSINGATKVPGQTSATVTVSGLTGPSTQTIVVTDETTNCTATASINVTQTDPIGVTIDPIVNATCNMGAQVSVTASGGSGAYSYSFVESGDSAGTYSSSNTAILDPAISTTWDVHVKDVNDCVITAPVSFTIATDPIPDGITTPDLSQCPSVTNDYTFTVDVASGIGAPYEYSIGNGFQNSPTFTVNAPGTYTVTVKDDNGCTNTVPYTFDILPALELSANITALPSCDDNDGEITVTGSGGSGSYTYSISPTLGLPTPVSISITGNVISGVPSGTYKVTMTDTSTSCTEDITLTLGAATPVNFTTSVNDVSCNTGSDGVITVNLRASNDNPLYTYEITAPIIVVPQNSNVFSGLAADTYTVRVNSGRGCFDTEVVEVKEPVLLEAFASATAFGCAADNSVNTSTITITETGGTAPYRYSINGTNYFTTNTFDIIDTGSAQNITVFVQDANGCIETNTVAITPLPEITAAVVIRNAPIDCKTTGSVIINVTGGSANLTFQMLPNGTPQASEVFAITEPGTYYFQVNDLDTGCYFLTEAFVVAPYDEIDAVLATTQNNNCFGDTNGELELTIDGYVGGYTYQLYDGTSTKVGSTVTANTSTNPEVITGLPSGNYYVDIEETDTPFCTTNSNVVNITTPSSPVSLNISETSSVTCDNNQGTITAIASGGTSPYQYELTGSATVAYSANGTFTGLAAGNYTVNVRDANDCTETGKITLTVPSPIDADFTANTTLLSCFGDQSGSITVSNVTGGQETNYSYILNTVSPVTATSGPQSSNVFKGLGAGTYSVTVTDGYNCAFTSLPITIAQPLRVNPSLVVDTTPTCLNDATLTLSASGGTGTYEYSDSSTFTSILGSFTSSVTFPVSSGTHRYFVRDANECTGTVSNDITVEPVPTLQVNLATANPQINCYGDTNGVIEATAQGGLGNYIYTLQDTSGNVIPATQASPGIFSGLSAGTYKVNVESGDCSAASAGINITEPEFELDVTFDIINVSCFGEGNGMAEFVSTGGTGIVKYAISPKLNQFFTSGIFEDLAAGDYTVIAQDELGCYKEIDFTINEPKPVIVRVIPGTLFPEVCTGEEDGSFSIEIQGGSAPYSLSLDDYNGTYITGTLNQIDFSFDNLGGGDHTIYVRDNQGCESEAVIEFPDSVLIESTVDVTYECQNNLTGNIITVTVDDSIVDLTQLEYSLNDGAYQSSNIFTNLPPSSNNFITVRHTNACTQMTEFFDIETFDPLSLLLSNGELNEIVATASGGTGGYHYTFDNDDYGSTNTYIITRSGTYTVTVTDSSGCVTTASITMDFIDLCIPNYFSPNGDGITDTWMPGCAINYPNIHTQIFDRYGRRIARLRAGESWDGRYNNKELPTGDYWYVVKLNDNDREFVGHFTLYR